MKCTLGFKINITKFNALLLMLLSLFYLQENKYVATIIITIPLVVEVMLLIRGVHRLTMRNSILISLMIVLYTVVSQLLLMKNSECLSVLFSVFYYIFTVTSIKYLTKEDILNYVKLLLFFGIIILVLDAIYRFLNPLYSDYYVGVNAYLKYKGPGILFIDTNNTGMVCLAILCLLMYLDNVHNIKYKKIKWVYCMLLMFTFSRAAILAYLFLILFLNNKVPKFLKVMLFIVASIVAFQLIPSVTGDASTGLKLQMFERMLLYWKEASIFEILFGVGFKNSIVTLGVFTHSWPLTYTFEFGFIGFFLILGFWWFIYRESNRKALYILFPCLIAGISYLPLLMQYIYVGVAIVIALEKKKKEVHSIVD